MVAFEIRKGADTKMDPDETCRGSKSDTALPIAETCLGKIEIPTKREQAALRKLKRIKEHVRELKRTIQILQENNAENHFEPITDAKNELTRMKIEWETWVIERDHAAKERMLLLGHETSPADPPSQND